MSLLSNLSLDYEILADDPIEMGIRYGKSILSSLSNTVVAERFVEQKQVMQLRRIQVKPASRIAPSQTTENRLRTRMATASRRNFIDYSARPSAMGYSRRNMVGAL